ncbi:hypothetical protein [Desulfofundulus thermosubterraneus]|nr:hypothetical protein [Desulfofundulus thermosubterraneus]
MLRKRCIAVFTVSARFTSFIGFFKYAETYGLNSHQAAAFVVARRALGFAEKLPREFLELLSPKEGRQRSKASWGKLFGKFKAAKAKLSRYYSTSAFTSSTWLEYIFAGGG